MIISKNVNGHITEVQCDICNITFDNKDELDEFITFDFVMGPKSLYPNKHVSFMVCQDCFTEAFPDIFEDDDDLGGWTTSNVKV